MEEMSLGTGNEAGYFTKQLKEKKQQEEESKAAGKQSTPDATLVSPLPNAKGKGKAAAKPAAAKAAAAAVPHAGKMCLAVSATGGSYGKASAALVHAWPY